MDLETLKNLLEEPALASEVRDAMQPIIATALARGSITAAETDLLLAILDLEIESSAAEADAAEKAADALKAFVQEIDGSLANAQSQIETIDTNFNPQDATQ